MCQICRLGQRHARTQRSTAVLLNTSQFSTLVVTDHRQNLAQPPLPNQTLTLGDQSHDPSLTPDENHGHR